MFTTIILNAYRTYTSLNFQFCAAAVLRTSHLNSSLLGLASQCSDVSNKIYEFYHNAQNIVTP